MRTMKVGKMLLGLAALLGLVLATATTASAAWTSITYDDDTVKSRINDGADTDGYYYTSTRPLTGDWTLGTTSPDYNYEWRSIAQVAWGVNPPVTVWSANNAAFYTFSTNSANGGAYADLQIKVVLSEAINGAAWQPRPGTSMSGTGGAAYSEYSLNGTDWTTVATSSASGTDETTYDLSFSPTTELYLRLRVEPEVGGGVFYTLNFGQLAFTPVPEPVTMAVLGAGALMCLLRRRNRR